MDKCLEGFESSIFNLLLLVSIYAIFKTDGLTIFVFPLLLVILLFILIRSNRLIYPVIRFNNHLLIYLNSIWFFFLFFFYVLNGMELRIPSVPLDDFSVYSRIAFYNDTFGLENIQGFNNLFNQSIRFEVYHHFELWFMNFSNWINSIGRLNNLFLVFFPIIGGIFFIGAMDVLSFKSFLPPMFIFIFSSLVIWPYDFIINLLNFSLPKGGVGQILISPKSLIIFPIIISLIKDLRKEDTYYSLSLISLFFYPLLIPLVTGSIIIYQFIFKRNCLKNLILTFSVAVFYVIFVFSINSVEIGFNILGMFVFSNYPKIFFVSYLIPIFSFGFVYLLYFNKKFFRANYFIISFFIIALILSSILWLLFFNNINSNQLFRNLFVPLFSLSVGYIIVKSFLDKKYIIFMFAIIMYILPFFMNYNTFQFAIVSDEDKEIASMLSSGDKVLFIPDPQTIKTTYDFVENMFMPLNTIFLINENLHFVNTSSAFPINSRLDNKSSILMLSIYRKHSPYFNYCGEINLVNFNCSVEFMKKFNLKYLITFKNDFKIDGLIRLKDFESYSLFMLK